jgi:hypothetical protein
MINSQRKQLDGRIAQAARELRQAAHDIEQGRFEEPVFVVEIVPATK